jgi:hypothetical protein
MPRKQLKLCPNIDGLPSDSVEFAGDFCHWLELRDSPNLMCFLRQVKEGCHLSMDDIGCKIWFTVRLTVCFTVGEILPQLRYEVRAAVGEAKAAGLVGFGMFAG